MPEVSEQTRIPAPLARVWPLLSDPAAVAACIPGAELAPESGDGTWRGTIRVRFGPTVAVFRGEAVLDYDHAAHRCTIEGRGVDGRGASRALSAGTVVASAEGEETLLAVEGRFSVSGPLETFANAGGVHVARAILAEFASNMARMVAEHAPAAPEAAVTAETGAAAPPAPATPPPARELSGFRLAWRALLSWFRSLFRKGNP